MTNQTDAGVVLLNSNGSQLEKVANWPASVFAEQSPGWWLDFVDAQRLAVNVFGQEASSGVPLKPDAIVELDFTSDASKVVVESQDQAFTLGDVRCAGVLPDSTDEQAGCGRCFATDAERGVVHILDGNPLQIIESIVVDEQIGLPPRSLGRF